MAGVCYNFFIPARHYLTPHIAIITRLYDLRLTKDKSIISMASRNVPIVCVHRLQYDDSGLRHECEIVFTQAFVIFRSSELFDFQGFTFEVQVLNSCLPHTI